MDLEEFVDEVDAIVEREYGHTDGGDLCFSLIETGVIDMSDGTDAAARIVAQHMEQA